MNLPIFTVYVVLLHRQRGQWKLKQAGKRSTLTEEREKALDELGFVWDSHKAAWEMKYNELSEFKARTGHCNVPTTYAENPQLAMWLKVRKGSRALRKRTCYTIRCGAKMILRPSSFAV